MSLTSKILIGMFSGLLLGSIISLFGLENNQYIKIYLLDGFLYIGGQVFISLLKLMVVPFLDDFCDFPDGYQLPGYMNNHPISIKVWDASENIEYIPEVNYTIGSGDWGDVFTVIDVLIVHELGSTIDDFSLYHLYPNPFNSSIVFDINSSNHSIINISIFNLKGERIDKLLFNPINQDKIIWDASNFNSGIYFVKFHNSKFSISKKITLIK